MSGANGGVERSETVPGPELPRFRQKFPDPPVDAATGKGDRCALRRVVSQPWQ